MSGPPDCPEQWCPQGACHGARLDSLLLPDARWLWEQLAERADRRDDACLTTGTALIIAPAASAQRAAVQGLVGTTPLAPGGRRSVRLEGLTRRLQRHGPKLTPGAVAAHAVERPLGGTRLEQARQAARIQQLRHLRASLAAELPAHAPVRPADQSWESLRRTGRVARILRHPAPEQLLRAAAEVLRHLPVKGRIDRRVLAERVTGDPHGLDAGTELGSLVLAEITVAGLAAGGTPPRSAWGEAGVALDSLGGGLLSVGLHPRGWSVPAGQPAPLPPYVLTRATWPRPQQTGSSWVFVTENPSVTAAALKLPAHDAVRLLCTVGTPSSLELAALGRIADSGWRIAVRADFDPAGLQHTRAVLDAVPGARPWRMGAQDYAASLHPAPLRPTVLEPEQVAPTPWDPGLALAIRAQGRPAYEEALIEELVGDILSGHPPDPVWHTN